MREAAWSAANGSPRDGELFPPNFPANVAYVAGELSWLSGIIGARGIDSGEIIASESIPRIRLLPSIPIGNRSRRGEREFNHGGSCSFSLFTKLTLAGEQFPSARETARTRKRTRGIPSGTDASSATFHYTAALATAALADCQGYCA